MDYMQMDMEVLLDTPFTHSPEPRYARAGKRVCMEGRAMDRFAIPGSAEGGMAGRARGLGFPKPVFYSGIVNTESRAERICKRPISKTPYRVLDAPSVLNDYYLNVLDWSRTNVIALGLGEYVYLWNAETKKASLLTSVDEDQYISSVSYSREGALAVGISTGRVEVYDIEKGALVRGMGTRNSRIPALSWGSSMLSAGGRDGSIFNHDVRAEEDHVSSFLMHSQEVCGLRWNPEGDYLASGSNDNTVGVWKLGSTRPKEKLSLHTAAVRALAWCPWKRGILCTGGGSKDKTIKSWDVEKGELLTSTDTGSQVCGIIFSERYKELISTHGYADNDIRVWRFCNMRKIGSMNGHDDRVLYNSLSPDGSTLATCAADENLNFWKLFESKQSSGRSLDSAASSINSVFR